MNIGERTSQEASPTGRSFIREETLAWQTAIIEAEPAGIVIDWEGAMEGGVQPTMVVFEQGKHIELQA